MLKQRIITALILFFLVIGVIFFTPPLIFAASCWLLCLIANYELAKMYRFSKLQITVSMFINTLIAVGIRIATFRTCTGDIAIGEKHTGFFIEVLL